MMLREKYTKLEPKIVITIFLYLSLQTQKGCKLERLDCIELFQKYKTNSNCTKVAKLTDKSKL